MRAVITAYARANRHLVGVAALAVIALQVIHLVARERTSLVDYQWAVWQYAFSLVLLGPLVAGLGAAAGRRVGQLRWLTRGTTSQLWCAAVTVVSGAAIAVFAAGLLAVTIVASRRGTPLDAPDAGRVLIACGLGIIGYVALGSTLGARWPNRFAPVAAIALAFVLTMIAWLNGLESIIRFGGASGGLVGIQLSGRAFAIRIAFWAAATVLAFTLAAPRAHGRMRFVEYAAGLAVVGAIAAALTTANIFTSVQEPWTCTGSTPRTCIPERYDRLAEQINGTIEELAFPGILAASSHAASTWYIDDSTLIADVERGASPAEIRIRFGLLSQFLFPPGCLRDGPPLSEAEIRASDQVRVWLDTQAGIEGARETAIDAGIPTDTSEVARDFISTAIDSLPSCPATQ